MDMIYCIPPVLTLTSLVALGVLSIRRKSNSLSNRLFLILCLLGMFLYADILFAFIATSRTVALWVSRIDHIFIVFLPALYIHFFQELLGLTRRSWAVIGSYSYCGILALFAPTPYFIADMATHSFGYFALAGPLYPLFGIIGTGATLYALIVVSRAIGQESSPIRKNRLRYILFGFGILGLFNGLNFLPIHGISIYPPGNFGFIPLSIFAIGLFKHDLLDMGLLIKRSLVYSIITAILTGIYAFIITAANTLASEVVPMNSVLFTVGFFLVIAFIFGPLKSGTQRIIDRLFDKNKYDYQDTLKRVSRKILSILDVHAIGNQLQETIHHAMKIDRCLLFLNPKTDPKATAFNLAPNQSFPVKSNLQDHGALVRYLTANHRPVIRGDRKMLLGQRSEKLNQDVLTEMIAEAAVVALPMIFQNHLNGYMLLGEKLSGDGYTKDDLDLLETLSAQSALAIENAKSYQKIESLNAHLERKVSDRTQALSAALDEKVKTQEQLIRSESLAAIGQLVAGVAHELNNPLTSAISLLQTAMEDLAETIPGHPLDTDITEDLSFVEKELKRAKEIVRSLLSLSRQTPAHTEQVDLNDVIRDAHRILKNQHWNVSIRIEEHFNRNMPTIKGNFATLGQVVLNIIKNALQAVETRNGRIRLSSRFDIQAQQVVFECEDNGAGISPSHLKDIFKPFFTTKEVGKGTGLGLYICHEIVRKHGGNISVESKVEKGSKFTIRIPAGS
ncbi:MAG: GAF domain-containing protein [Deltaproteobacteria bacterium]|nr:GAF domain-containing protein [Deltaproteobacteria bacterium]